jgi:hypothetical protein
MSPGRDLAGRHPLLYHVAEDGALPGIEQHGLLSTSALLRLFEVEFPRRTALEAEWRHTSELIRHPVHGTAVLRDQKPMRPDWLRKCLGDGLTPSDWYRLLNGKVFFWPSEETVATLLTARAYRDRPHRVLVVDTQSLLADGQHVVTVSAINSGNARRKPAPRGPGTFVSASGELPRRIAEVAVDDAIVDVMSHVQRVERRHGDDLLEVLR